MKSWELIYGGCQATVNLSRLGCGSTPGEALAEVLQGKVNFDSMFLCLFLWGTSLVTWW